MSQGRFGNRPFEYKGFVHQVGQTVTFPSGFAKRELVLVEDPNANYKDYAAFEFLKTKNRDNTTLLDGLRKGQAVTVKFCLSANESKKSPGDESTEPSRFSQACADRPPTRPSRP